MTTKDNLTVSRALPWVLTIGGAIGLLAAFVLTVEKIELILDPTYVPSCSINPILSCGSVMDTPQAVLFGFPNSLLGVAGFAIVLTIGVVLLTGATLPRWIYWGLQLGATAGIVFVHWLIFQSLYRIGALCPYCMVVWVVMIPIFWYVTLHNVTTARLTGALRDGVIGIARMHGVILALWYIVIIAMIGVEFWDYWRTLL
ncbi:vitamin K epoxide reductase family protein [Stackebrandtia soli]|uniref:vitamin K epoxide reductase family protein n=1 Tax=Stackebrandtia soli TaxID=1892856 RepID=UPI0039ED7C6B